MRWTSDRYILVSVNGGGMLPKKGKKKCPSHAGGTVVVVRKGLSSLCLFVYVCLSMCV